MQLPDGARLLAEYFCPNAMFSIDDHILAQGHPNFLGTLRT